MKFCTPDCLLATTIPICNAIGHIGGFVGPFALGALHDALPGPSCPHSDGCVSEWGGGTAVIASLGFVAVATCGVVAARCGGGLAPADDAIAPGAVPPWMLGARSRRPAALGRT
jgi:hypothetical protein